MVGLVLGLLYCRTILDVTSLAIPAAFAFVFESIFAVWFARRRLGRPLTSDQRVRVSLGYTTALFVVLALLTAVGWMPWSKALLDRMAELSGPKQGLAVVGLLLGIATVALARYLSMAALATLGVGTPARAEKPHAT